jgi:hypothetical protein
LQSGLVSSGKSSISGERSDRGVSEIADNRFADVVELLLAGLMSLYIAVIQ